MSLSHVNSTLPPTGQNACSGRQFAQELATLVDEIQRTREWFNAQIEAQLSSLNQLRSSMQVDEPDHSTTMARLFESPPSAVSTVSVEPVAQNGQIQHPGVPSQHQAIVLPPVKISALAPELEQATLRELNDALSRAFSEISARGGMIS